MKIFISREFIAIAILFFFIGFIGTYVYTHNVPLKDALPLVFSIVAAFFAYLTYLYSLEKMRLELLEKRWEVYEGVLKFISMVSVHGRIPKYQELKNESDKKAVIEDLQKAHESFRGIGYHKVRTLFGPDIYPFFDKLNSAYASLVTNTDDNDKHLMFLLDNINKLPDIFNNYLYFGDYTKNRFL